MINLETPKKYRPLVGQAHQVAMNLLRPNSRKYDHAEHEYPKELDMLAAMIDGLSESGAAEGAGAAGVRTSRGRPGRQGTAAPRTAPTWPRCCRSWRCAGATSACCCRCRARASATPRSRRWPTTSRPSGSRASGPAMAITEPGCGSDSANIQTTATLDGDDYVINGEKIYVTAGDRCDAVVVWATLDKIARPGRDQVLRGPEGHPGHDRGAARAQARHPRPRTPRRSASRTAGCPRRTCSAARRSTPSRASPARWRPSTTPARWSPRWRSAAPGRRSS